MKGIFRLSCFFFFFVCFGRPSSACLPLSCATSQKGPELRSISMFKEQHQKALVEFKGAWELAKDLPHAVQEEQEDRRLLAKLAVRVG